MRTVLFPLCVVLMFCVPGFAQVAEAKPGPEAKRTEPKRTEPKPKAESAKRGAVATLEISAEGREALSRCKAIAASAKGLRGAERARVLGEAASNYDRVVGGFAIEPAVAAAAAYAGAELWRRHGSLPLAEKDYLHAAATDVGRYGPRGLLGAADMQRRQKRFDEALASYRKVAVVRPESPHAQTARLATARLLGTLQRTDEAIAAARVALECAKPGSPVITAANHLALFLIDKKDFDAAQSALDHAAKSIVGLDNGDPVEAERLQKAVAAMSARRALQRARDKSNGSAADAVRLDADRRPKSDSKGDSKK